MKKITGTGVITDSDYNEVKFVGKTRSGKPCTISIKDAINMSNVDLGIVEKDDAVAQLVFTSTYDNTDETATDTKETWEIESDESLSGAGEILLGLGMFYIGGTAVALTRGGGKFTVEREFREIKADGDRGPVKGRIVMEGSKASITVNALTFLTNMAGLYPAISVQE